MSNAEKIKQLQNEIQALQTEDERLAAMVPEQRLAIQLHSMLCNRDHTEGCGWFYEFEPKSTGFGSKAVIHRWNEHAHQQYLAKAINITKFCTCHHIDVEKAIDLITLIKAY